MQHTFSLGLSLLLLQTLPVFAKNKTDACLESTASQLASRRSGSTSSATGLVHQSSTEFVAGFLQRKLNWGPLNRVAEQYIQAKGLRAGASTLLCSPLAAFTMLDTIDAFLQHDGRGQRILSPVNALIALILLAEPGYQYLTRTGKLTGEKFRAKGRHKNARVVDFSEKNWALCSALLRILGGAIFTARHNIHDLANDDYEVSSLSVPMTAVRAGLIGLLLFKMKAGFDLASEFAKRSGLVGKLKKKLD